MFKSSVKEKKTMRKEKRQDKTNNISLNSRRIPVLCIGREKFLRGITVPKSGIEESKSQERQKNSIANQYKSEIPTEQFLNNQTRTIKTSSLFTGIFNVDAYTFRVSSKNNQNIVKERIKEPYAKKLRFFLI
jgi:hypothetical protein